MKTKPISKRKINRANNALMFVVENNKVDVDDLSTLLVEAFERPLDTYWPIAKRVTQHRRIIHARNAIRKLKGGDELIKAELSLQS